MRRTKRVLVRVLTAGAVSTALSGLVACMSILGDVPSTKLLDGDGGSEAGDGVDASPDRSAAPGDSSTGADSGAGDGATGLDSSMPQMEAGDDAAHGDASDGSVSMPSDSGAPRIVVSTSIPVTDTPWLVFSNTGHTPPGGSLFWIGAQQTIYTCPTAGCSAPAALPGSPTAAALAISPADNVYAFQSSGATEMDNEGLYGGGPAYSPAATGGGATDGTNFYWNAGGEIYGGTEAMPVATPVNLMTAAYPVGPVFVAFDGTYVYTAFTYDLSESLMEVEFVDSSCTTNCNQTVLHIVNNEPGTLTGFALQPLAESSWVASPTGIYQCPMANAMTACGLNQKLAGGTNITAMTVDAVNVYWADAATQTVYWCAAVAGTCTNPTTIPAAQSGTILAMTTDANNLYWIGTTGVWAVPK